jgi:hypothetical protein
MQQVISVRAILDQVNRIKNSGHASSTSSTHHSAGTNYVGRLPSLRRIYNCELKIATELEKVSYH